MEPGIVVGKRYQLLAEIGTGGMSTVYLALDTVLNKQWAAKEIKDVSDPVQRELIVQSIVTEANMIKSFDHPAIPRIVDLVDENGTLYVIMDYVEGRSLSAVLAADGPQPEDEVVNWGLQLCDALEYLHRRTPPVIYRDMKPSNVMLKPNGLVQIIDFGIAREYRDDGGTVTAAMGDTVQLGTRGYAPPEQYGGGGQTDARTDVYALGATMYTMLTGKNPAEPPYQILPLRQVDASLSPALERVVAKATQPDPADRYQDCAEFAYALSHYREEDAGQRADLERVWKRFVGLVAASAVSLAVGVGGLIGYNVALNSDFGYWMQIARQTSNEEEARSAYVKAAEIMPGSTEPYEGLASVYRSDQVFTTGEEQQLRAVILPSLGELRANENYARMAFDIGKLYWYNYAAGDAATKGTRSERIRAAAQWMNDAAADEDFEHHELARAYAGVAEFETAIVPLINEGSDAGLYRPYFDRVLYLLDELSGQENDVVRLETANLALDAAFTYPRKLRADGISQKELLALVDKAQALVADVHPTTDVLDAEKERAANLVNSARQAVADAYVDVEA